MQKLRKSSLKNVFDTKYVQNRYFADKCSGNHYFKMLLMPNMYKMITLKLNAKEIITLNEFDAKYIQNHSFKGKCSGNCHFKMHLTPNMYKIITLQANAQEIVTLKCI